MYRLVIPHLFDVSEKSDVFMKKAMVCQDVGIAFTFPTGWGGAYHTMKSHSLLSHQAESD